MDKKKSLLNVGVSISFKLLTTVIVILVRKLLILYCGNEVNGLNALYLSIVGFLSIAELGVGSAITFCMYKPIVEQDNDKVSALYHLFQKLYIIIGGVILISGFAITPFIHYFAKDYSEIGENLYLTFIVMLLSVVLTYAFSSKISLINAYKNNYITTAITSGGLIFQYVLQIIVLIITHSFVCYLICRIVAALLQWIVTYIIAKRKHKLVIEKKCQVDAETKKILIKNIRAMFMHKIGTLFVTTADSVIISTFLGVVILGKYSNYITILTSLSGILKMVFQSLTSVMGHLYVEENKETACKYYETFHLLNFAIGTFFFLGYYSIIDNLIALLFSYDLILSKSISFVITLNEFIVYMRQSAIMFKDATGTFYNDRWKPLVEGIVNIILSILFVKFMGVVGVIVATIVTNLLICHVVDPFVLYKHAFSKFPNKYYFKNYSMIAFFTVSLLCLNLAMQDIGNNWTELFVNGFISVGMSIIVCGVVFLLDAKTSRRLLSIVKKQKIQRFLK